MSNEFQFIITFSPSWILSKRESRVAPPAQVLIELKKIFNIKDSLYKISDCEGVISGTDYDESRIREIITDTINKAFDLNESDKVFDINISACVAATEEISAQPTEEAEKEEPEAKKTESNNSFDFLTKKKADSKSEKKHTDINSLVGAEDFKLLAGECEKIAKRLIEHDLVDSFTSRTYVVSINDGFGLTTYLNAFADLVENLGLFEPDSHTRVAELKIEQPNPTNPTPFVPALSLFQGRGGKIVCIDITEWMTKLSEKEFREFLKQIDIHTGENIVFFRIPFVEQNIIMNIKNSLSDILTVRALSVPPFTNEELSQCATSILSERGYTVDDDVWEVFYARIAAEKSDGRFYGINTVRKIVREMLYAKQLFDLEHELDDKILHKENVLSVVDSELINSKSGYEQLDELVGMDGICEKVKEIIAQIETAVLNDSLDKPCIHMRFVGSPGTGKTTVARIIGTILKEKGILRNGSFFEHSGRDLCGRFVGETAPKTSAICRDAYGSVLFIDEAYSLYRNEGFSNADYGREAIDTLIAEMENHRTDFVVIMAGYCDEMEKLMEGNIGLKSRMPYYIEFPNYTREQLASIFFKMADKSFSYDKSFTEAVKSYFNNLSDTVMNAKDFSNARFSRNLFERTWGKAALRCQMNQIPCTTLTVEDFALATSDKEFHNIMEQKKKTIGF